MADELLSKLVQLSKDPKRPCSKTEGADSDALDICV